MRFARKCGKAEDMRANATDQASSGLTDTTKRAELFKLLAPPSAATLLDGASCGCDIVAAIDGSAGRAITALA